MQTLIFRCGIILHIQQEDVWCKVGMMTIQFDYSALLLPGTAIRKGILLMAWYIHACDLWSVVIPHSDPDDECRTGPWNINFNATFTQLLSQAYFVLL